MSAFTQHRNRNNWEVIIFILIGIALLFFWCGCSPEARLSKLLKKHPELAKTTTSIVVKHDTLITKEMHKDSVINNIFSKDTVFIKEGKAEVKYVYITGSKAYLSGSVAPDTVVRIDSIKSKVTTVIQQVDKPLSGFDLWCKWTVILALIAGCLYLGIKNFPAILKAIKGGL